MLEKVPYHGWKNAYRLSNGSVEVVVTADVGPRVIRFGFIDGPNEFFNDPETLGSTGDDEWHIYGGHRLWHAPEQMPRSYWPDNAPVTVEEHEEFVRFVAPVESGTGIQKEIDLTLDAASDHVRIEHRLRNTNLWAVELAPWALSVMAEGGKMIAPLPARGSHTGNLLPTNMLTMWAYTDMQDERWTWGTRHIMLQQQPGNTQPQKVGLWVPDGWAAYANHDHLFVKTFPACENAFYPDYGCNFETFTNEVMLEVESLGPLTNLAPDCTVEYVENWYLFAGVPAPENDADVNQHIAPLVQGLA